MSTRRSDTRRYAAGPALARSGTARKPRKTLGDVQQGLKEVYSSADSAPEVDIVLVPGLGTDPTNCWKFVRDESGKDEGDFNWVSNKEGLATDFPKSRVLLYQYESAWIGPMKVKQNIHQLAYTLLSGLQEEREKHSQRQRPIVFIGHSMGGLVIAKAVILAETRRDVSPTLFPSIAGCVFFGTPFEGATAAAAASWFASVAEKFDQARASSLLDMMKPGDESLRELKDDFLRLATGSRLRDDIQLFCFYEMHPTDFAKNLGLPEVFKKLIPKSIEEFVRPESARLTGIANMGLARNHRDLVKFAGTKDEVYNLVRGVLKRVIHGAQLIARSRFNGDRGINHQLVKDVLEALEPSDYCKLKNLEKKYGAMTSSWLTEEQEFKDWAYGPARTLSPTSPVGPGFETSRDCLFVRGPKGRGKTSTLLAALKDIDASIKADAEPGTDQGPLLAYYFCESTGEATELLKSLIWQLVNGNEDMALHAKNFKKKARDTKTMSTPVTVDNLWQTLQDMLADELIGSKVFFVINNLHALPEDSDSTGTLLRLIRSELGQLSKQRRVTVRWLITSRNVSSVNEALLSPVTYLMDLEEERCGDHVQRELRKHAYCKVSDLRDRKQYNKAVAYFASSLIGRRAENTQWIDIACVHLEEIPSTEHEFKIKQALEAMPQDLASLLDQAWLRMFAANPPDAENIKELLRALVLTQEDPTADELAVLAGFLSLGESRVAEVPTLVEKCKPLLVLKRTGTAEPTVRFLNDAVKEHLKRSDKLLGMSEDERRLHHGVLAYRCLAHLGERFGYPGPEPGEEAGASNSENHDGDEGPKDADGSDGDAEDLDDKGSNEEAEGDEEDDQVPCSDDDDSSDYDEESEEEMDLEQTTAMDKAYPYMVKHWLTHASKATTEIADGLSTEPFWEPGSLLRRRWLIEYDRLTRYFDDYFLDRDMTALHIASSIGFVQLVSALLKNGHEDELNKRDHHMENTPLHLAADFDKADVVEELLHKGASIDDGIKDGYPTPLHMAALRGNVQIMKKLIRHGASINAWSTYDQLGPVMNAAILSCNRKAVELMVNEGASLTLERVEDDYDGPLALAALCSDIEMFEYLVGTYAAKLSSEEYDAALVRAAEAGREDILKKLLERQHPEECFQQALAIAIDDENRNWHIVSLLLEHCRGLDCNDAFYRATRSNEELDKILEEIWDHVKRSGGSLDPEQLEKSLISAAGLGRQSTVELLLDRFGINSNSKNESSGTALTEAAFAGDIDMVKILVKHGADVNHPDGWALQAAAAQGHYLMVEFLLDEGAHADACTKNPKFPQGTALQAACESSQVDITRLLLRHRADPNLGPGLHTTTTPLIAACERGEAEIMELLVDEGAKVDVCGGLKNSTPLVNAAVLLPQKSLQHLLKASADINLPDGVGNSALIAAAARGDKDTMQFLLNEGADMLHCNNNGENAMQVAFRKDNTECLEILVNRVSKILQAVKSSMDEGNVAVAKVVRSVYFEPLNADNEPAINYDDGNKPQDNEQGSSTEQPRYALKDVGGSRQGTTTPASYDDDGSKPQPSNELPHSYALQDNPESRTEFEPAPRVEREWETQVKVGYRLELPWDSLSPEAAMRQAAAPSAGEGMATDFRMAPVSSDESYIHANLVDQGREPAPKRTSEYGLERNTAVEDRLATAPDFMRITKKPGPGPTPPDLTPPLSRPPPGREQAPRGYSYQVNSPPQTPFLPSQSPGPERPPQEEPNHDSAQYRTPLTSTSTPPPAHSGPRAQRTPGPTPPPLIQPDISRPPPPPASFSCPPPFHSRQAADYSGNDYIRQPRLWSPPLGEAARHPEDPWNPGPQPAYQAYNAGAAPAPTPGSQQGQMQWGPLLGVQGFVRRVVGEKEGSRERRGG